MIKPSYKFRKSFEMNNIHSLEWLFVSDYVKNVHSFQYIYCSHALNYNNKIPAIGFFFQIFMCRFAQTTFIMFIKSLK